MYAYICKEANPQANSSKLLISGREISFFVSPVAGHAEFLSIDDGRKWSIRFFKNSNFEQLVTVHFFDTKPENFRNQSLVGKACWLNNGGSPTRNAELLPEASTFLRGSQTLAADRLVDLTTQRSLAVDRNGIAYFSDAPIGFQRAVLCQTLAIAYEQVLHECLDRLTNHVKGNRSEETLKLYEAILRFNAGDYFSLPVKKDRHELFGVWQALSEHFQLRLLNEELTKQLSDVAMLLREEREREHARLERERAAEQRDREKRFNNRLAILSTFVGLLSLFSLLSLVELTPKHFKDARESWAAWLSQETPPEPQPQPKSKASANKIR